MSTTASPRRSQAEPRLGIAYNIKPTSTVLQVSYARTLETPFNENLVLASLGCNDPVINDLQATTPGLSLPDVAADVRAFAMSSTPGSSRPSGGTW